MNNKRIGYLGRRRAAQGMSLIEVMLSITVLAVLVGMATPAATTIVQNSRIRGQASDLLANLAIARAEAAKRGARVTLCPSNTWNQASPACNTGTLGTAWEQGYIIFVDTNQNGAVDAGETLLAVNETLAGNNTLTSNGLTNAPVNVLQFRPSGAANIPANGTFKLCDSRSGLFGRTITVSPTGRATSATATCP